MRVSRSLDACLRWITDGGLKHLKGLANLETLYLRGTQVTPKGVQEFQKALPNCEIEY